MFSDNSFRWNIKLCLPNIIIPDAITPRESSDDTDKHKEYEDGASTGAVKEENNTKNVQIKRKSGANAQGNQNTSSTDAADGEHGEDGCAVGGDDDDSVFLDDAISTQSQPHRLSVENTASMYSTYIMNT